MAITKKNLKEFLLMNVGLILAAAGVYFYIKYSFTYSGIYFYRT